jgi:hypothetical protein
MAEMPPLGQCSMSDSDDLKRLVRAGDAILVAAPLFPFDLALSTGACNQRRNGLHIGKQSQWQRPSLHTLPTSLEPPGGAWLVYTPRGPK